MSSIPVNLAVEDELSEAVLRQLLHFLSRGFAVGRAYRRGGSGYLRRTIHGWNRAARGTPFVVLTDLDRYLCPKALVGDWLSEPQHANLVFRVAVREVEAWLLADVVNFARYLAVQQAWMPARPDTVPDAKRALVDLARKSRSSDVRHRIVPKQGSTARQGPDYNGCLVSFVARHWDIGAAAEQSPSLARTVNRLSTFEPSLAIDTVGNGHAAFALRERRPDRKLPRASRPI